MMSQSVNNQTLSTLTSQLETEIDLLQQVDYSDSHANKTERYLIKWQDETKDEISTIASQRDTLQNICKNLQEKIKIIKDEHQRLHLLENEKTDDMKNHVDNNIKPMREQEAEKFEDEKKKSFSLKENLIRYIGELKQNISIYKEQEEKRKIEFDKFRDQIQELNDKRKEKEKIINIAIENDCSKMEIDVERKKKMVDSVVQKTVGLQGGLGETNEEFDRVSDELGYWREMERAWNAEHRKIKSWILLWKEYSKSKKSMVKDLKLINNIDNVT